MYIADEGHQQPQHQVLHLHQAPVSPTVRLLMTARSHQHHQRRVRLVRTNIPLMKIIWCQRRQTLSLGCHIHNGT